MSMNRFLSLDYHLFGSEQYIIQHIQQYINNTVIPVICSQLFGGTENFVSSIYSNKWIEAISFLLQNLFGKVWW